MITDDFTYNSITFSEFVRGSGYMATFVNGDQVGIRDTISSIPGADGVERYKSFYRDRLIEIRGFVKGTSESDLYIKIQALRAAFDINNLQTTYPTTYGFTSLSFTEPGIGNSYYTCKPIKNTLVVAERRTGLSRAFSVLLEAKDPNKYTSSVSTFEIVAADATGASIFPLTFPIAFSGNVLSSSTTIDNTGITPVFPTLIRIDGPCSGPSISNSTDGGSITLTNDVSLTSTEYILIDSARGTIYKYDSTGLATNIIQYLISGSSFWKLLVGDNTITYSASTLTVGTKVTITVTFTN